MRTSDGNSTTRPLRRRRSKRFDRSGGSPMGAASTVIDTDDAVESGDDIDTGDAVESGDDIDTGDAVESGEDIDTGDAVESGEDIDSEADDVEDDDPESGDDLSERDADGEPETDDDRTPQAESSPNEDLRDGAEPAESATTSVSSSSASTDEDRGRRTDSTGRNRTLDQLSPCGRCGHDVSIVHIEVDGNVLLMESCDNCDTRRWQLAGEPIELQQALDHVGEHTGRRR